MALTRNLIINIIDDQGTLKHNTLTLYRDNVIELDVTLQGFSNLVNFDMNDVLNASVVFVNGKMERYYERSMNIPVTINQDGDLLFKIDVLEDYTRAIGNLDMQISISGLALSKFTLDPISIPVKQTLAGEITDETDITDFVYVEPVEIRNDVQRDATYSDSEALGATQAADIIRQIEELRHAINTNHNTNTIKINRLQSDIEGYKAEIDKIASNLSSSTTITRLAELKKLMDDAAAQPESISAMSIVVKDLMTQIENLNVYINNRLTNQEFALYKDQMNVSIMDVLQQINNVSSDLSSHILTYEKNRTDDMSGISSNFISFEADLNELKVYGETTNIIKEQVDVISDTMGQLIGTNDSELPTLKTYRIMKLKMYKNSQLAILSDSGTGNSIRVSDGQSVIINFANPVDSIFVSTVSPYSRLQFVVKSVEERMATIKCFNLEKVTEDVTNALTGETETNVVMDLGAVNIHELPVGMEIHILYLA